MKVRTVLMAAIGLGLAAWLIWRTGPSAVAHSILELGAGGAALILAFQLALAALAGVAWALLGRGRPDVRLGRFITARLVRDAGAQVLPFTQLAGVAMGARSLSLEGVAGDFAVASTLADLTLELTAQVAYLAIGAAILAFAARLEVRIVLGVVAGLAVLTALFALALRAAPRLASRLAALAPQGWPRRAADFLSRPGATRTGASAPTKAVACLLHLAAWILTGVQTWIILRLLRSGVSLGAAIAIDSMASGAKALGFLFPAGFGVQEGALILFGQLFGVPASAALALSLIRRGRDVVLAAPILLIWQLRFGDRVWRIGRS